MDQLIFSFRTAKGEVSIPFQHIYRIEAQREYSTICTTFGKFLICRHLKAIEEELSSSGWFVRVHRSILINKNQVREFRNGSVCMITLNDGFVFRAARARRKEVAQKLK